MDWEKTFRVLRAAAAATLLGVLATLAVYGCLFVRTLTTVTAELPATADKAIARESEATRKACADQMIAAVAKLDAQITALQTRLFTRVDKIEGDANQQLVDLQTSTVAQVAETRKELVGQLNNVTVPAGDVLADAKGLLPATKATITNAGNLIKDGQDSLDDSYDDIRSLIQSAETAATQTAYTMETVRKESPVLLGHVSGIAGDFHDATTSLDQKYFHPKPMTKGQKVKTFFSNLNTLLIAALRGGAL
jgi:hypothetical protein